MRDLTFDSRLRMVFFALTLLAFPTREASRLMLPRRISQAVEWQGTAARF
jgi:hypothetical protein